MTDKLIRDHLLTAQTEISAALRLLDDTATVVRPGDNLLALLADAEPGATFALDPAFCADLGDYVLPKPVTLKSLVDPGPARVTADLPGPILRGCGTVQPGTVLSGIRFEGLTKHGTVITAADDLVLDRIVVLGSPEGQHRGLAVNAQRLRISRCHVGGIWRDGFDTQAIAGWTRTKDVLIEDCFLEAAGENVMFGGADAGSEDGIPQDVTMVDCHLFKPLAWRDLKCVVKNLYELKNAKRITLRRCTLEHCWAAGQSGFGIVLTVRNQAADDANPWSTIRDCVIEGCVMYGTAGGLQILARDDGGRPSVPMENLLVRGNRFVHISPEEFGSNNGRQLQLAGGGINVCFEDNVWDGARLHSAILFDQPALKWTGLVYRDNRAHEGSYGIFGQGAPGTGKKAIDFYCPDGYTWERNVIVDYPERTVAWPPGTTLVNPESPS